MGTSLPAATPRENALKAGARFTRRDLRQLKRMMAYIGTPESYRQVLTRSPLSLAVVVVV